MFVKLLKYEFKSLGKWYLSLYAIAGFLSFIIGFWIQNLIRRSQNDVNNFNTGHMDAEVWLFLIISFAFAVLIIGLLISTFFLVVSRFYKNVYGRQGYLTMTLPVTNHQIILSKLVSALIWYLLAGLVIILSIVIIVGLAAIPVFQVNLDKIILAILSTEYGTILLFILSGLIDTVMGILLTYFAISLGQLFREYRLLLAVAFYIGIHFVISIFQMISSSYFYTDSYQFMDNEQFFSPNPILMITNILLTIGFYVGTHFIMTKKLNLQ